MDEQQQWSTLSGGHPGDLASEASCREDRKDNIVEDEVDDDDWKEKTTQPTQLVQLANITTRSGRIVRKPRWHGDYRMG